MKDCYTEMNCVESRYANAYFDQNHGSSSTYCHVTAYSGNVLFSWLLLYVL